MNDKYREPKGLRSIAELREVYDRSKDTVLILPHGALLRREGQTVWSYTGDLEKLLVCALHDLGIDARVATPSSPGLRRDEVAGLAINRMARKRLRERAPPATFNPGSLRPVDPELVKKIFSEPLDAEWVDPENPGYQTIRLGDKVLRMSVGELPQFPLDEGEDD